MPRTTDAARVEEASRLYHSAGLAAPEVARVMQVSERTVRRWLGDTVRPPGPRPAGNDQLILRLKDEGLSFQQIALRVHMSKTGVRLRYYALTGRPRPDRPPRDHQQETPGSGEETGEQQ